MSASDAKAEKRIRQLAKLTGNRICPNCHATAKTSAGFDTVCMKFQTFVCSLCKTSHQAISHRCKSIRMSAWTAQEVECLANKQGLAANEYCQQTWLARAPPPGQQGRPSAAHNSPVDVYKQFVTQAYEYKKYYQDAPTAAPAATPAPAPRAAPAPRVAPAPAPPPSSFGFVNSAPAPASDLLDFANFDAAPTTTTTATSTSSRGPHNSSDWNAFATTPVAPAPVSNDWNAFAAPTPAAPSNASSSSWQDPFAPSQSSSIPAAAPAPAPPPTIAPTPAKKPIMNTNGGNCGNLNMSNFNLMSNNGGNTAGNGINAVGNKKPMGSAMGMGHVGGNMNAMGGMSNMGMMMNNGGMSMMNNGGMSMMNNGGMPMMNNGGMPMMNNGGMPMMNGGKPLMMNNGGMSMMNTGGMPMATGMPQQQQPVMSYHTGSAAISQMSMPGNNNGKTGKSKDAFSDLLPF